MAEIQIGQVEKIGDFWEALTPEYKMRLLRWVRFNRRQNITLATLPFVPVTELSMIRLEQMRRMLMAHEFKNGKYDGHAG